MRSKEGTIMVMGVEAQWEVIDYLRNTIDVLMGSLSDSLIDDAREAVEEGFMAEDMVEMMAELNEEYVDEWRRLDSILWKAVAGTLDYETAAELYDLSQY